MWIALILYLFIYRYKHKKIDCQMFIISKCIFYLQVIKTQYN
jgi:predicted membrane protein